MRPTLRSELSLTALIAVLGLGTGCAEPSTPVGGPAPDVTVQTATGPFRLADARGRQVVLQFAPADSVEAWAALAAAASDLVAEGALVIGVSTDGAPPESPFRVGTDAGGAAAAAFGYTGAPLAVVVDRRGVLRGVVAPREADDLFALAAPVLLEGDAGLDDGPLVPVVGAVLDADAVDRLVRAGAALIDLRDAATRAIEGPVPYALVCPLGRLGADVLPADIGAAVVVVGPDAAAAAEQAAGWGFFNVHVVADASGLATGPAHGAPAGEVPVRAVRRSGVRG